MVMSPEPGNPLEVEGTLNPGAARGPDGHLYLFPRLVAKGNYSRIGIARVRFDDKGDPVGVERLGIALEPAADYELRPGGGGGCEDPRITFVEPLQQYVMTYTAFSPHGPRIALALSKDLFHWDRVNLAVFEQCNGLDFNGVDNKDALFFPVAIPNPHGEPATAMLHRPLFPGTHPHQTVHHPAPRIVDIHRESIWISYCTLGKDQCEPHHLCHFGSHHRLASPVKKWERLKIGGGTPPMLTSHGWLVIYHGVCQAPGSTAEERRLEYSAGIFILSQSHPSFIRYRSREPILTPEVPAERQGMVADVVFPTGIDRRSDLGQPNRFDVYYGMADSRIGVARLEVPEQLPAGARADSADAKA
jgi:predicted GH43/DUF377 family glycosyl hydrolase